MKYNWPMRFPLIAPALAVLCSGCSEPDWARVIGNLNYGPEHAIRLTVPGQVSAGEEFLVTIQTLGGTGCIRPGGSEVTVAGNRARIVPYDDVPLDGRACLADLRGFDHTTRLSFPQPGSATLRIVGYFGVPDTAALDSADFTIRVEPTP